ncbi:MAG: transcription elongation factor GreA [Chloroflexota bacterium]
MVVSLDLTVGEAIRAYIAGLKPEARPTSAPELQRFARWVGTERRLRDITPAKLDEYQDYMTASGLAPATRLEPLKLFLSHARTKKLIDQALAVHVRIRRKSADRGTGVATPAREIEVTRSGHEQLTAELARLELEERPKAVEAIARARADGDLRENAPYHAAREHAAEIDRRIQEIRDTLNHAVIVAAASGDRAVLGALVVVMDLDDEEEISYILVGPGEVDRRGGKISIHSPVGSALVDRVVGDIVEVAVPAGVSRFKIVRIERAS